MINKFVVRTRAIITQEDKLLVVKHAKDADFYALPGGHVELGEDIKESFEREIIEEFGIKPIIGKLLFIHNFIQEEKEEQNIEFFFEVKNSKDFLDISKLGGTYKHELVEICWFDKNNDKKILPQLIFDCLKNKNLISEEIRFIK